MHLPAPPTALLFAYAFLSNIALAVVPHEPAIIWYGPRLGVWTTTLVGTASTVPAVPTSVVVQTPSRGPYQMMAGSWGTTARAMLDRNAYAKSSAVGGAGRCMARCFAHRSQADIKPPQNARRVAGKADLEYDAPSPGDEALHEESHRRQHDSEGVGIRKGVGARQAGRVRWHRVVVGRRPVVSDEHPG